MQYLPLKNSLFIPIILYGVIQSLSQIFFNRSVVYLIGMGIGSESLTILLFVGGYALGTLLYGFINFRKHTLLLCCLFVSLICFSAQNWIYYARRNYELEVPFITLSFINSITFGLGQISFIDLLAPNFKIGTSHILFTFFLNISAAIFFALGGFLFLTFMNLSGLLGMATVLNALVLIFVVLIPKES